MNGQRVCWRDRVRAEILADLDAARRAIVAALGTGDPGGPAEFSWHGEPFLVDRDRMLVLLDPDPGADDNDHHEDVDLFGGEGRLTFSHCVVEVFATHLAGLGERVSWRFEAVHTLNLAVVQPMVNPAFGPLFWLAMAWDAPAGLPYDNFYDLVGPMMYRMREYPILLPTPWTVRDAQVRFLAEVVPDRADEHRRPMSDADWLAHCERCLAGEERLVGNFFEQVGLFAIARARDYGRPLDLGPG
jgi:hypothetical protein